ncbi:SLAP domain-containing protein [Companilactobacillus futsaii]|uniref:SLAP domain-containing protein n=1 Tax=Companilactobacillus futsaii TaxID=938155 RepID=UPI00189F07CA|nr:CAP domain-containing protein [Companilactobacillus futsaii]
MKFGKSATIIAALAMATTGALVMSQKDAEAAGVATVSADKIAHLYTANGDLIHNRALAANSAWAVGKIIDINDEMYYQVATNEYLNAVDASYSVNVPTIQQKLAGKIINGNAQLYRDDTNSMSNRILANGSSWLVGKIIVNKLGQYFAQVSTHEYADGLNMAFNMPVPQATYVADFGINTQNNTNTNTNNNNTSTNVDTNNDNNAGSNQNTSDYQPNLSQINKYFVAYLNALHKANGTTPVQLSQDLMSYATQRAQQQDGLNLDHSTADRDMSENLEGGGFDYMKYAGVKSDKDAAYFMLKSWYDEDNNYSKPGEAGHFGHRAALIYSGPNVGLGITNKDAAFEADWNYGTLDQFNNLYYYTGSNPNTKFISKDAI